MAIILNVSKWIFFFCEKFINPQITPANFSHLNLKDTPGQEGNWTFFYNSPTSLKVSILLIRNDGSTQLNPFDRPWMTIDSPMEARYINYLTLSLYPSFSVYCLLIISWVHEFLTFEICSIQKKKKKKITSIC